ncbi:hypothetical protein O3G_MSEX000252 [Manduca sexta]|nr:hypothetical protein O3G_MSEX000252 [Manduca sexta]
MKISLVRRRYYSMYVVHKCVRSTQVHTLFLHSYSSERRQSDMFGERLGAGPTTLCAFPGTRVHQLPDSELRLSNVLRWNNPVTIILAQLGIRTQDLSAVLVLVPCTITTTPRQKEK